MKQRVQYTCNKCNYTTNKKSSYEDHLNRKRPCKKLDDGNVILQPIIKNNDDNTIANVVNIVADPVSNVVNTIANAESNNLTQSILQSEVFTCQDCKITFSKRQNLLIHQGFCKGVHPFECPKCRFRFTTRPAKYKHMKRNNCKPFVEETQLAVVQPQPLAQQQPPSTNTALTPSTPTTLNTTVNGNHNTITNNTNQTNNTQNNQTINIYGLGKEDVSYFTEGSNIHKLVSKVFEREKDGVCDLIYLKHFHPDHPENHNVKKMLKHDEVMHYFDGATWQRREARVVAQNVLHGVVRNLTQMIDSLEAIPKRKADKFMDGVGEALQVDFTGHEYDYDYKKSDEEKQRMSEQIVRYINNFIYEKTRELFETGPCT